MPIALYKRRPRQFQHNLDAPDTEVLIPTVINLIALVQDTYHRDRF